MRRTHPVTVTSCRSRAFSGELETVAFFGAGQWSMSRTVTAEVAAAFRAAGALRAFIAWRSCCAPESVQGETETGCAPAGVGRSKSASRQPKRMLSSSIHAFRPRARHGPAPLQHALRAWHSARGQELVPLNAA